MKFTFKKEKAETGLRAVGNSTPSTIIKIEGKDCGRISASNWQTKDGKWGVGLMVKGGTNPNCNWIWVFFKTRFDEEKEARIWLNGFADKILTKYEIRSQDFEPA